MAPKPKKKSGRQGRERGRRPGPSRAQSGESLPPDESESYRAPAEGSEGSSARCHPKVLLVDDDDDVREMVESMLASLGCVVIGVANADEALAALAENGFEVLLTDMRMPGRLDGLGLAAEAIRRHPGLKVVYATGYTEHFVDGHERLPSGELLVKPFRLQGLQAALARALEKESKR